MIIFWHLPRHRTPNDTVPINIGLSTISKWLNLVKNCFLTISIEYSRSPRITLVNIKIVVLVLIFHFVWLENTSQTLWFKFQVQICDRKIVWPCSPNLRYPLAHNSIGITVSHISPRYFSVSTLLISTLPHPEITRCSPGWGPSPYLLGNSIGFIPSLKSIEPLILTRAMSELLWLQASYLWWLMIFDTLYSFPSSLDVVPVSIV